MKVKRYIIFSILGLIGTAILGFFLFKNFNNSTISILDILPGEFSRITYLKLTNNTTKYIKDSYQSLKSGNTINQILTGIKEISVWSYLTGKNNIELAIINLKKNYSIKNFEKDIKKEINHLYPNIKLNDIKFEEYKGNIVLVGTQQNIEFFKKLKHNFKDSKYYKNLPQNFDGLILINIKSLKNTTEFNKRSFYLNKLDYLQITLNFSSKEINSNIKIFTNQILEFKKPNIKESLLKLVNNDDYLDLILGNWIDTLNIKDNSLELLYTTLSLQFPQLNFISKQDFINFIKNNLQNFEIKVTNGNNPFNIGLSILLSGYDFYNIFEKTLPYIKNYLSINYKSGYKLITEENKIKLILKLPNMPLPVDFSIEKNKNFTLINILSPDIDLNFTNDNFVSYKNNLIFLYINLGKIINKLYTSPIAAPYISEKNYEKLKNAKLIGTLNFNKNYIEFNFSLKLNNDNNK